jgi:hypothetical protein
LIPWECRAELNGYYKKGLVKAAIVHQYNMVCWLLIILRQYSDQLKEMPLDLINKLEQSFAQKEMADFTNLNGLDLGPKDWEKLIKTLKLIGKGVKGRAKHFTSLIEYLEEWREAEPSESFLNKVKQNKGWSVFHEV